MSLGRITRNHFVRSLFVYLAAFLSCASFANEQVPYRGSAIGMVTEQLAIGTGDPLEPFGAPFLEVRAQAVGNFTHVGKAAVTITYRARLTLIDGEVYVLGSGIYTVTAANGCTITGPFTNRQRLGSEDFRAEVAVAGGTGGFRNATGDLIAVGKIFADGSFFYDLDGTMTPVGRAKR